MLKSIAGNILLIILSRGKLHKCMDKCCNKWSFFHVARPLYIQDYCPPAEYLTRKSIGLLSWRYVLSGHRLQVHSSLAITMKGGDHLHKPKAVSSILYI